MEWRPGGSRYIEGRSEHTQALSSFTFSDNFSHVGLRCVGSTEAGRWGEEAQGRSSARVY